MSHRLEQVALALPIEVGGVTLYKTHDGKAHASSLYSMLLSGVISLYQ